MSPLTKVRMMLLPAATPPAGTDIWRVVALLLVPVCVPRFLTKAMPARASEAMMVKSSPSASVATTRRAHSPDEYAVVVPEFGDWRIVRAIASPLRIATAAPQLIEQPSPARRGRGMALLPAGPWSRVQMEGRQDFAVVGRSARQRCTEVAAAKLLWPT